MKQTILTIAAAFLLTACASAQPQSSAPVVPVAPMTVATWNVAHFVDEYDNPYEPRDQEEEFQKSDAAIDVLVETIRTIDADVFVFEEIEGSDLLRAFAEEHFEDMGYINFVSCPDDNWHQGVALMSRFPLGPLTSMTAVSTSVPHFEEGETNLINDRIMAVEVWPPDAMRMLFVVVHFKAGQGENNENWRHGQIEYLRTWLDDQLAIHPQMGICILGDFNCTTDSEEFRLFTEPESGPIYHRIPTEAEEGTIQWGGTIDHILVNDALLGQVIEGSGEVVPTETRGADRPSDHRPVMARFSPAN